MKISILLAKLNKVETAIDQQVKQAYEIAETLNTKEYKNVLTNFGAPKSYQATRRYFESLFEYKLVLNNLGEQLANLIDIKESVEDLATAMPNAKLYLAYLHITAVNKENEENARISTPPTKAFFDKKSRIDKFLSENPNMVMEIKKVEEDKLFPIYSKLVEVDEKISVIEELLNECRTFGEEMMQQFADIYKKPEHAKFVQNWRTKLIDYNKQHVEFLEEITREQKHISQHKK